MVYTSHHDFGYPADPRIFGDLFRRICSIDGGDLRSQLFGQTQIAAETLQIFARKFLGFRCLHKQRRKPTVEGFRHTRRRPDHLGIGRGRGQTNQNVFSRLGAFPLPRLKGCAIQLICGTPHGNLTQSRQILCGKEMLKRLLCLALPIYFSRLKTLYQFIRFKIHQFDLVGPVKHMIRYPLFHCNSRNRRYQIVQRLQMLHIHCGIHIDPGLKQFLHILIPLCVAAALCILVGQLVHQNQLRLSLQRCVQVKLLEFDPTVVDLLAG